MVENKNTTLLIISIPFPRVAKSIINDSVIDVLTSNSDLLLVCPFSNELQFIESFDGKKVSFFRWQENETSFFIRKLHILSELLRRNGYWFKFRNSGMEFYYKNQHMTFGFEGKDFSVSSVKRFLFYVLGFAGQIEITWRIFERFAGYSWFSKNELVTLARKYDDVVLLQCSNWGMQDRGLAQLSKKYGWRKILIPYSVDQLYCNGHLINDFDSICVPGPFEENQAKFFHNFSESKIYKTGSLWLRYLRETQISMQSEFSNENSIKKTIIYAGVSPLYYTSFDELKSVDLILEFIKEHHKDFLLQYRPVVENENARQKINEKYRDDPSIEIIWPESTFLSMDTFGEKNIDQSTRNFITQCRDCRLFIMSYSTSMCLEVTQLQNCGVISNMIDRKKILQKRKHEYFKMDYLEGVNTVYTENELLETIDFYLENEEASRTQSEKILKVNDFANKNFKKDLKNAIFGES